MNVPLRRSPSRALGSMIVATLAGASACDQRADQAQVLSVPKQAPAPAAAGSSPAPRAGITALEPGATLPTAAGQSIYLPITTRVAVDEGRPIRLVANVAVRNADESRPILVTLLRHRDADGQTVRDYLRAPVRLAPKATYDVVIKDTDSPGPASSVRVEWVADRPVVPPIVDAVMLGTAGSQGISFTGHGQVIDDRQHPAVPPR